MTQLQFLIHRNEYLESKWLNAFYDEFVRYDLLYRPQTQVFSIVDMTVAL